MVEPMIQDKLTEHSWPKFLHPYPLSEKYFLVSCKPTPDALWGIYLADVFRQHGAREGIGRPALLEPIPFARTPRPPVIRDRVEPDRDDATVYMDDVYAGRAGRRSRARSNSCGSLRTTSATSGSRASTTASAPTARGSESVLGTVPVEADGSALFRMPANTPISVQPLDGQGKAAA